MKSNQILNITEVIFLLGAGASVDAGMPTVDGLTKELKNNLHTIPDVNGNHRPEFRRLFEVIAKVDKTVEDNYEQFFKWLYLLNESQKEPFSRLLGPKEYQNILEKSGELSFVIGGGIKGILKSRQTNPEYLSRFGDFIPQNGRLKIFSLNYDCCLEDACRSAGIDIATGFSSESGKWNSDPFRESNRGINLYKLHGSLRWFTVIDNRPSSSLRNVGPQVMELDNKDQRLKEKKSPVLLLGPGNKMQPDNPFLTLLYEFHIALSRVKVCIIIGYGNKDKHINNMLEEALDNGLAILDINPGVPNTKYLSEQRYKHFENTAKEVLENGLIEKELQKLLKQIYE